MQCGNSAAVADRRVDRRRVRDRVDGGDKEHQTDQRDGVVAFQSVLEQEETIPLASIPFHENNDSTFGTQMQRGLSKSNRFKIPPDGGGAPQCVNRTHTGKNPSIRCSAAELQKTGKDET
jgi:hypothetical protein